MTCHTPLPIGAPPRMRANFDLVLRAGVSGFVGLNLDRCKACVGREVCDDEQPDELMCASGLRPGQASCWSCCKVV